MRESGTVKSRERGRMHTNELQSTTWKRKKKSRKWERKEKRKEEEKKIGVKEVWLQRRGKKYKQSFKTILIFHK